MVVRKYLYGVLAFVLAFGILSISLLRSSTVNFALAASKPSPSPSAIPQAAQEIKYVMTLPGKVLPDSVLWPLKAIRDRIWYTLTFSDLKKAELALFFSDKRLVSGKAIFQTGNNDLGLSTVTKGEKYMEMALNEEEIARSAGQDTSGFLTKLATASLKHREIIEKEIIPIASEQTRPNLIQLENYSKNTFTKAGDLLTSTGHEVPNNPFDGQ